MGWNGSGGFTLLYNFVNDAANGIKILASRQDAMWNDMAANGFANTVTRDGQGSASANQPMNGYIHTGVGNATATNNYAAAGQIQSNALLFAVGGGTANAITATFSPAISNLVDGMQLCVRAPGANTITNPTFSANGTTVHTITKAGGSALAVGDIQSGQEILLRYVLASTRWELLNPNPAASSVTLSGNNTWTGIQTFAAGALPGGSSFTTTGLGIGMTAANILDITQNVNGNAIISLLNGSGGTSAAGHILSKNSGGNSIDMLMFGTNFTSAGIYLQDGGLLTCNGLGGLTIATAVNRAIILAINNTEGARLTSTGLGVGMTPARALDVTGTFGVTGAATLGGAVTASSTIAATGQITQNGGLNVGYLEVPQSGSNKTLSYTTIAADSGKMIIFNGSSITGTIDSNANVPYNVGTTITFININASALTIAITSDTMHWVVGGATGSRTLAQWGMATAVKTASTTWVISGGGLT